MAQFKNGAPVYPKNGMNVNIFIPAIQKDMGSRESAGFNAYALNLNGDFLDLVGSSTKEGEMIKYYQIKSRFDKPDYTDPNIAIGTFTGLSREFNGAIYQNINWNHEWFEHGFLGFNARLRTEIVGNAYVLERDVQAASQADVDKSDKTKKDKELQDYINDLIGDDKKKQLTAFGGAATGITANTTNIILGAIIVFVMGLIGVGAYRKLKR